MLWSFGDLGNFSIKALQDLTRSLNIEELPSHFSTIQTSTLNKNCAQVIQKELKSLLDQKYKNNCPNDIIVNKRQHNHLFKAYKSLKEARRLVAETMNEEIILQELKISLQEINSIIGIKDNEDMLTELFKNFCIGKWISG